MQPTENQATNNRKSHYIILAIAVFELVRFCIRYFDAKSDMTNPLIPKSLLHHILTPYYYSSGMYVAAIVLQVLALYSTKFSRLSVVAGAILIVIGHLTERFYYQFIS
ncbi:hypothetical protein ACLI1A_14285 [Flavobacterium sp. RHBU_3]|uniref:hypothetical protein n=1 Tax=Flavobacterium sp. RHBU_3 TaxID=3391184 RepID=UPI003984AD7E